MKSTITHQIAGIVLISALCITNPAIAQNGINVDNNILINDISNNTNMRGNQFRNVNTTYNGNQQQAPVQAQALNVQFNNNISNVGVYASPVVTTQQAIRPNTNKAKAPKITAIRSRPVMPKPKPKTRSANPVAPNRPVVRPAARPIVAAPVMNTPVIQQVAPVTNPVVVTNVIAMNPAVQNFVAPEQMVTTNIPSAPVVTAVTTSSTRMSSGSAGSGSSKSIAHRKSKNKKHGSFCYAANKKIGKLFAKTRKNHFNPAKCFVWN